MRIEVTQRHIDEGTKGEPESCAIALAVQDVLRREVRSDMFVSVQPDTIHEQHFIDAYCGDAYGPELTLEVDAATAEDIWRFAIRFDAGTDVEPFGFDAEVLND